MKIKNGFGTSKLTGKFGTRRESGVPVGKALEPQQEVAFEAIDYIADQLKSLPNKSRKFSDELLTATPGATNAGVINNVSREEYLEQTYGSNKTSLLPPKEKQVLTNYNNVLVELDNKEQQIVQYLSDKLNSESDINSLQVFLNQVNSTLADIDNTKHQIQRRIYNIQDKLEQEQE